MVKPVTSRVARGHDPALDHALEHTKVLLKELAKVKAPVKTHRRPNKKHEAVKVEQFLHKDRPLDQLTQRREGVLVKKALDASYKKLADEYDALHKKKRANILTETGTDIVSKLIEKEKKDIIQTEISDKELVKQIIAEERQHRQQLELGDRSDIRSLERHNDLLRMLTQRVLPAIETMPRGIVMDPVVQEIRIGRGPALSAPIIDEHGLQHVNYSEQTLVDLKLKAKADGIKLPQNVHKEDVIKLLVRNDKLIDAMDPTSAPLVARVGLVAKDDSDDEKPVKKAASSGLAPKTALSGFSASMFKLGSKKLNVMNPNKKAELEMVAIREAEEKRERDAGVSGVYIQRKPETSINERKNLERMLEELNAIGKPQPDRILKDVKSYGIVKQSPSDYISMVHKEWLNNNAHHRAKLAA